MRLNILQVTRAVITILLATLSANAKQQPPNIIFILADDMGIGDLGCYGQKLIKTPNLDRMAANGLKLTNMYSGSALCAPARCSFITGLHAGHGFVRNNFPLSFEGNIPIPADSQTIPKLLKKANYATACVGKWGLGYPGSWGDPLNQGFDHFYGYNCQRHAHDFYPAYLWNDHKKELMPQGNSAKTKKAYSHDKFTVENLKFIDENAGKRPFFAYMAYTIPHIPLNPPDLGEYENKNWPTACKSYAAMISRLDTDIGKILQRLKDKGIEKNTLIIFTSDNGPYGKKIIKFFNSAGTYKGQKASLFEGGVRSPFIAYWPGTIPSGKTSDHVAILYDMLPTFAELAGVNVEKATDGVSIVPTLLGKGKQKKHPYLYWELGGTQATRFGNYKAIKKGSSLQLYNLEEDPSEKKNIAKSKPEITDRAQKILNSAHTASDIYPIKSLNETFKTTDIGNGHKAEKKKKGKKRNKKNKPHSL